MQHAPVDELPHKTHYNTWTTFKGPFVASWLSFSWLADLSSYLECKISAKLLWSILQCFHCNSRCTGEAHDISWTVPVHSLWCSGKEMCRGWDVRGSFILMSTMHNSAQMRVMLGTMSRVTDRPLQIWFRPDIDLVPLFCWKDALKSSCEKFARRLSSFIRISHKFTS